MSEDFRNSAIKRLIELNYNDKTAPHIVDAVIDVMEKFHPKEITSNILINGPLQIDLKMKDVFYKGIIVSLTPIQYRLLEYFMRNAGIVISNEKILADIWGEKFIYNYQYIRGFIRELRKKINHDIIKTKPRQGYYLERFSSLNQ